MRKWDFEPNKPTQITSLIIAQSEYTRKIYGRYTESNSGIIGGISREKAR